MQTLALLTIMPFLWSACAGSVPRPKRPIPVPNVVATQTTESSPRLEEQHVTEPRASESRAPVEEPPEAESAAVEVPRVTRARSEDSRERLRQIAEQRRSEGARGSYKIGPGDLIETTVYKVADLNRKVRVGSDGSIDLPFLGKIRAGGLTASELADDMKERLAREFLKNPQVDVFISEYRSAQVAVTGAVAKPGLYPLVRDDMTILDALSEAGGLTKEAGASLEFVPAGSARGASRDADSSNRIPIDVADLMRSGNRGLFDFPVVPGDLIYVGEGGTFAIEGWVDKPGSYPLARGTTVLSAISTGGGPLFPAKLSKVELIREGGEPGAARTTEVVDLGAVRSGEESDIKLLAGDVVRVPSNAFLVPPWAVFKAVSELIRFGASVAIF